MSDISLDLLAYSLGSVSAPAGCGKTHLIADAILRYGHQKPVLVLTHTNAGKAALEGRLRRLGVHAGVARVTTLDSWAIRLVQSFPGHSGLSSKVRGLAGNSVDYGAIRAGAVSILAARHVDEVVSATYSRVIVDEYQDCGALQHRMICLLSALLPTIVLGDPLQVIFNFAGPVVDWQKEVMTTFPPLSWKARPWRWINAGAPDLGDWLLNHVRPSLLKEAGSIDLASAPGEVEWVQLRGSAVEMNEARLAAAARKYPGTTLIIADSKNKESQWDTARRARGTMVEANDMADFIRFAGSFEPEHQDSFERLLDFSGTLLSGLSPKRLVARSRSLQSGRARTAANSLEQIAMGYLRGPSYRSAADMLDLFNGATGIFAFRPDILRLCLRALRATGGGLTFHAAALRERERFRHLPRALWNKSVGSTLLLKGLEADVAVVMDPEKMNAQNLYVAMTRGSKRLIICSPSRVLRW